MRTHGCHLDFGLLRHLKGRFERRCPAPETQKSMLTVSMRRPLRRALNFAAEGLNRQHVPKETTAPTHHSLIDSIVGSIGGLETLSPNFTSLASRSLSLSCEASVERQFTIANKNDALVLPEASRRVRRLKYGGDRRPSLTSCFILISSCFCLKQSLQYIFPSSVDHDLHDQTLMNYLSLVVDSSSGPRREA